MRRLISMSLLLGLLAGCATPVADWRDTHTEPKRSAQLFQCLDFFEKLDDAVKAAKAGDAQWARVPGFPYLRASRFLASFGEEVTKPGAGAAFADWAARMRTLDHRARAIEIANLPRPARDALGPAPEVEANRCGDLLMASDLARPAGRAALGRLARVPDHYADWQRVLGLYPLSALPFAWGSFAWREDQTERFGTRREGASVVTYHPAPEAVQAASLDADEVAGILAASTANALGIPEPSGGDLDRLFDSFAPVLRAARESDADKIGAIVWRDGRTEVDTDRPSAYRLVSHTRVGDQVLLQLNYVFWFPARPSSGWFDLLAGHLDGLIWRVTLAPDGRPLIYDSIHPCGCYHLFFPARAPTRTAKMTRTDMWSVWNEGAAEPGAAPALAPGERMVIHLAPGTHYITALAVTPDREGVAYDLLPYDRLRSLALPDGGRRSMFSPSGLVEGTARGERFFFWPMGIASAGAMRQWGTHATAFVGKRHFDDPFLLEESYDLPTLGGAP